MKALKRCLKERKNICKASDFLINNASVVADIMKNVEMTSDTPWFIADFFDNILEIHNECLGHYKGGKERNDRKNVEANELREQTDWIRTKRDTFRKREKATSDRIIAGDMTALEDLLGDAYERFTGDVLDTPPTQEDLIREAIEHMDDEDEFED